MAEFVSLYTPLALRRLTVDGQAVTPDPSVERSHRVYDTFATIAPGGTADLHYDLTGAVPQGVEPLLHVTASFSSDLARSPAEDDTVDSSICYGGVADLCLVEIDPETEQYNKLM